MAALTDIKTAVFRSRLGVGGHIVLLAVVPLLALPLFRPYLIDTGLIYVIYGIFAISFLAFAPALPRAYAQRFGLADFVTHLFVLMFLLFSIVNTSTAPWDKIGLILFLLLCYMYGKWIALRNGIPQFALLIAVGYLVVSMYVTYQLYLNQFSYNTYINWSNASFKIGYLDYALYGVLAFLFFQNARIPLKVKLPACLYIFFTIAISGARYSIIFLFLAVGFKVFDSFHRRFNKDSLVIAGSLALAAFAYLIVLDDLGEETDVLRYTGERMSALSLEDTSVSNRIATYSAAVETVLDRPLFGLGMGESGDALEMNYPHNVVLEASLEAGVLPGAVLLFLILLGVYHAVFLIKRGDHYTGLATIYLIGAYSKSFSLYESRLLFFFIALAVYCNVHYRAVSQTTAPPAYVRTTKIDN